MHRHQSACDTASVSQQSSRVCVGGGVKERRRTASLVLKSLRDSPRGTSAPKISARPVSRVTVTTLSSTSSRSSSPASSTNVCFRHVVFSQSHCPSLPRKHARRAIHGHTHATPRHTHRERERHSHTSFLAWAAPGTGSIVEGFALRRNPAMSSAVTERALSASVGICLSTPHAPPACSLSAGSSSRHRRDGSMQRTRSATAACKEHATRRQRNRVHQTSANPTHAPALAACKQATSLPASAAAGASFAPPVAPSTLTDTWLSAPSLVAPSILTRLSSRSLPSSPALLAPAVSPFADVPACV
jgi:hypothetical protein